MRKFPTLAIAGALWLAFGLGACTTEQELQVTQDINAGCLILAVGTAITVEVASSAVGAAAPATVLSTTISGAVDTVCATLTTGVQKIIEGITATGATATVTVTTTPPTKSGLKRTVKKIVVTPQSVTTYVVTPGGL